ncbi:hypothetical protein HK099_004973 [Clydaea vesicula]|uniref:G-protein coupled receptors family 3 profile domain-containing protein n=1 Tax=Clydaea vesicula TaxID=447962 RepID=A0AAD5UAI3_9FUNG|nr:hypothetical protein HK099_004973 [Clydaea vesicula]
MQRLYSTCYYRWGLSSNIGISLRDGLEVAFSHFNSEEASDLGFNISLKTLDDGYEINKAENNLIEFIENYKVFGLIGTMGTPIVASELNFTRRYEKVNRSYIPVIGHFSGGMSLRAREGEPFPYQIINIRGSYFDEASAMIYFLLEHLSEIRRVSVFYQRDAYGQTGLDGITKSLKEKSLTVHSSGHYERNTADVTEGINQIFKGRPQAICMFGTYQAVAPFVIAAKKIDPNIVFMAVTFTSPAAVLKEMIKLGGSESSRNFYVTQGLPLYTTNSSELIQELNRDYTAYNKINTNVTAVDALLLEGYVTGRFAIEIFREMKLNGISPQDFTNESFLKTVYSTSIFDIGDLRIGPFGDTSCDLIGAGCRCNQGARKIWISAINETTEEYYEVPSTNFQFATCGVRFQLPKEILFAISANLETSQGMAFVNGLKVAFNAMNEKGVMNGITVSLLINDDKDNATVANDFAKTLKDKKVVALLLPMWNSSFSEARKTLSENFIPVVNDLRAYTNSPSVIQLIPSFNDIIQDLYLFAFNHLQLRKFSAVFSGEYQELQSQLISRLLEGFDQSVSSIFTMDNSDQILPSLSGAIFIVGNLSFTVSTINVLEKICSDCVYLISGLINAAELKGKIAVTAERKSFSTSNLPSVINSSSLVVKEFYEDLESLISIEISQVNKGKFCTLFNIEKDVFIGYITGLFVVEVMRRSKNMSDPVQFINSIYSTRVFQFHEVTFTGFLADENFDKVTGFHSLSYEMTGMDKLGFCNYGFEKNGITQVSDLQKHHFVEVLKNPNQCTNSLRTFHKKSTAVSVIMLTLCVAGIALTLLGVAYVYWKRNENIIKASEVVMVISVLLGIIMMYCIVIVKVGYPKLDSCMAIQWMDNVSFVLVFGSMGAKSYRVAIVLRDTKKIDIRNTFVKNKFFLYITVYGLCTLISTYILVWGIVSPKVLVLEDFRDQNVHECFQKGSSIWQLVPVIFQLLLLILGIFLTIQTRAAWAQFSEYKMNGIAMYNFSLSMLIIYLVEYAVYDLDLALAVTSAIIVYNATVKIFLTLGNKFRISEEELQKIKMSFGKTSSFGKGTSHQKDKKCRDATSSFTPSEIQKSEFQESQFLDISQKQLPKVEGGLRDGNDNAHLAKEYLKSSDAVRKKEGDKNLKEGIFGIPQDEQKCRSYRDIYSRRSFCAPTPQGELGGQP